MQNYVHDFFYNDLDYYEGYESFCYQNCLRLLLKAMGISNPWSYINASMSLIYKDKEFLQHKNIRGLLPEYSNFVKRIYYDDIISAEDVFRANINFIVKNKKPIIVGVDTYYLKYASNYMKNHAIHTLIMCGYDSLTDDVYVVDWYAPWFFKGAVKKEDFVKARNSKNEYDGTIYSGTPIKNNWAYVENILSLKNPENLLYTALKLSFNQYYSGLDNVGILGVNALKCFKEDINTIDSINFGKIYYQFYTAIKRHSFFKQYLENHLDYCNNDIVLEIVDLTSKSIATLEIISMLLLKQSKLITIRTSERIIKNLEIVIENETIINRLIMSYLHSTKLNGVNLID